MFQFKIIDSVSQKHCWRYVRALREMGHDEPASSGGQGGLTLHEFAIPFLALS